MAGVSVYGRFCCRTAAWHDCICLTWWFFSGHLSWSRALNNYLIMQMFPTGSGILVVHWNLGVFLGLLSPLLRINKGAALLIYWRQINKFHLGISLQRKVSICENNQLSFELQDSLKFRRPDLNTEFLCVLHKSVCVENKTDLVDGVILVHTQT